MQQIDLEFLYVNELMRPPKPEINEVFIQGIQMDIQHIPWSSITDLELIIVEGYLSVSINRSRNP